MKKLLIIVLVSSALVLTGCASKPAVSSEEGASCGLTPTTGASCATK